MEGLYRLGEGMWYSYWKISLLSGEHAGGFCFMGKPVNGSVEIGYGILPAYQNRGFMSEAMTAFAGLQKKRESAVSLQKLKLKMRRHSVC